MTKHAANTHAVDLNTGKLFCKTRYVDVVSAKSPYLTCCHCWKNLRRAGISVDDDDVRHSVPKVYLVTGLHMVRTKNP